MRTNINRPEPAARTTPGNQEQANQTMLDAMTAPLVCLDTPQPLREGQDMPETPSPRAASQAGSMDTKPHELTATTPHRLPDGGRMSDKRTRDRRTIRQQLRSKTAPQPGTFIVVNDWPHRIEKAHHLDADRYEVTLSRRA